MWSKEEVHGTSARADLYHRIRLDAAGTVENAFEELRKLLDSLLRILKMAVMVVVRKTAVKVLTVEFETVEAPLADESVHKAESVFHGRRIYW
jgi:hypothetical protein